MLVVSPSSRQQAWVYDFVYYFHIPAFVLVTGYLSRSFRYTRRHLLSVLTTLIVPYIIFSWLMVWWRHLAGGEPLLDAIWTNPHWPMWYLIVTRHVAPGHPDPEAPLGDGAAVGRGQPAGGPHGPGALRPQPVLGVPAVLRDRPLPHTRAPHAAPVTAGQGACPGRRRPHLLARQAHRRLLEHAVPVLPGGLRLPRGDLRRGTHRASVRRTGGGRRGGPSGAPPSARPVRHGPGPRR
jgi:hypothetical protein